VASAASAASTLMQVLVVNAGSQTLKLRLLGGGDEVLHDALVPPDDADALDRFLASIRGDGMAIDAVGHRVVHGGIRFRAPVRVDADVEAALADLVDLAPLHQPGSLAGIRAVRAALPGIPAVACFDTAFHATLPAAAATYALPAEWRDRWPLRRFGFHGLSHARAVRRAPEVAGLVGRVDPAAVRVVSCHLGGGASLCAARGGVSIDTTMGFTPLEGLVMATRSGSVDPGLVLWLTTTGGLGPEEVTDGLETRAGLRGLAGSPDMRDVLAARARGEPDAVLAFDVYCHRLAQELAAMTASAGGVDVVVFTGGVGEHAPDVRAATAERLGFLGLAVDDARNRVGAGDRDISAEGATARCVVIEAREDLEIAAQTRRVLSAA
jgi:acetate kinase